MNVLFELLFNAWCVPYCPELVPEYLRGDPVRAYGQYAFEAGVKLGLSLAAASLDPKLLADLCPGER